jgi:hypothetical protein
MKKGGYMNGAIAQIVALTCHGNAYLHGRPIGRFFPDNSTCLFCNEIVFVDVKADASNGQQEEVVATSPDGWFELLQKQGTTGVQIFYEQNKEPGFSDQMSGNSFRNGGTWAIEAVDFKGRSHYWVSRWEILKNQNLGNNIWKLFYHTLPERTPGELHVINLDTALLHLQDNLIAIKAFADMHDCGGFSDLFNMALDSLNADDASWIGYHQDLAPTGVLSKKAIRILDACQIAWVFDRLGPWNNLTFEGEAEYEYRQISEALFKTIVNGILAAVNESY